LKDIYKDYSVDDFVEDLDFINWVKRNDNNDLWQQFIIENPHMSSIIESARQIVELLVFRDVRTINSLRESYKELEAKMSNKSSTPDSSLRVWSYWRYVAIALIVLTASFFSYFYFQNLSDVDLMYADFDFTINQSDSIQLVLANGAKFNLSRTSKELVFDSELNRIIVDNTQIINNDKGSLDRSQINEVTTPYGVQLKLTLSDGTIVSLNAGSKLIFPRHFNGKNRKVFLQGEAYFKVLHDKKYPFVVEMDMLNIAVLGTEFNVNNRHANPSIDVVLVEGIVQISDKQRKQASIQLEPYQRLSFNKTYRKAFVESGIKTDYYTSWKDGYILFEKQNSSEVLDILSQYYNYNIIKNSEVSRNITGKLELKQSFEEVMKVVSALALIDYEITDNNVFVKSE
jgi:transmembrane sensor